MVVLDIVKPKNIVSKAVYTIGVRGVLPLVGWALSGSRTAYQYLPNSVQRYLTPRELVDALIGAGFSQVNYRHLMLGSIALHVARA